MSLGDIDLVGGLIGLAAAIVAILGFSLASTKSHSRAVKIWLRIAISLASIAGVILFLAIVNSLFFSPNQAAVATDDAGGATQGPIPTDPATPTDTPPIDPTHSDSAPTPTTGADTFEPPIAGSIRHQGRLEMVPGPGFDLDAPPTDPKWQEVLLVDLYPYRNNKIVIDSASRSLSIGTQEATYQLCSTTTVMVQSAEIEAIPGNSFCVKTSADRYAGVKIVSVNGDTTTIDITVWDPPDV